MQKKVNVVIVTDVPQFSNPEIQKDIRNKAEAESWAEQRGYATVYLLLKKERVYADRLTTRIHAQAKQIERKSAALVSTAERGDALLENAVLMAIVVAFVLFVGWFLGWPW